MYIEQGWFAGNALTYHLGMKFSAYDADHDLEGSTSCSSWCHGAWWYKYCYQSNLNGRYNGSVYPQGTTWTTWRSYDYSLRTTEMKIRPGSS